MNFEVLVDDQLVIITSGSTQYTNKHHLTLVNDFEEGQWRHTTFQSFIWDNLAQTCLSERERRSLVDQGHTALTRAARNLRLTDTPEAATEGSELAEILLYGIMRHHFGALPVVPKIFYKQNSQDNAKGSDSVHVVLHADGTFTLWLGEAKFYKTIDDARLPAVVRSVKDALRTDKLRKESSIVTNVSDLDHLGLPEPTVAALREALAPKQSLDTIKPKLHVPILLLHECGLTATTTEMSESYRQAIRERHRERSLEYFTRQAKSLASLHLYSAITFHLILFPVPNKETLVAKFVENVTFYRGQ